MLFLLYNFGLFLFGLARTLLSFILLRLFELDGDIEPIDLSIMHASLR